MTETVYILLPVHNPREITRRFAECLKNQTCKNYHLILIDDGSTDGTAEMVKEMIPSMTVLRGNGDWWWAGSLQKGWEWLKAQKTNLCDVVLIINDDTEFEAVSWKEDLLYYVKMNELLCWPSLMTGIP